MGDPMRPLDKQIAQVESGSNALYVWRENAGAPWRLTDWEGIPKSADSLEAVSDCGGVDLRLDVARELYEALREVQQQILDETPDLCEPQLEGFTCNRERAWHGLLHQVILPALDTHDKGGGGVRSIELPDGLP